MSSELFTTKECNATKCLAPSYFTRQCVLYAILELRGRGETAQEWIIY